MGAPAKNDKKYSTLIYKLFNIVLSLSEEQQVELLKQAEELFLKEKRSADRKEGHSGDDGEDDDDGGDGGDGGDDDGDDGDDDGGCRLPPLQ